MSQLFSTVLVTSYYATIVGAVLMLLKKVLKKTLNANWQYLIWFVLLIKLIFPNGPESSISVFNVLPQQPFGIVYENPQQSSSVYSNSTNSEQPIQPRVPNSEKLTHRISITESIKRLLPFFWGTGTAVIILWFALTSFSLHRKLRHSAQLADERVQNLLNRCRGELRLEKKFPVLIQDIVNTPSIFGYFRPVILLTKNELQLPDKELKFILLHELAHYQRKDNLVNYLLLFLQAIHWFNPVVWYCFQNIRVDMEIATDERVLSVLDNEDYKNYSRALVSILNRFTVVQMAPKLIGMVDDKINMERRLRMISLAGYFKSNKNKMIKIGLALFVIFSIFVLTNATPPNEEIKFADPALEAAIRENINNPNGLIYFNDIKNSLSYWNMHSRGISNLEGIEFSKELGKVNFKDNNISDILPLSSLIYLCDLGLASNNISDLSSLTGLSNLQNLDLQDNQIADVTPLASLKQLESLNLSGNLIDDISPIGNLKNLKTLVIGNNMIENISILSSLSSLWRLDIKANKISDISALKIYNNLDLLVLDDNEIKDISSLANISCRILSLNNNLIQDISPLVANSKLGVGVSIRLQGNPLSDKSIHEYIPALQNRGIDVVW